MPTPELKPEPPFDPELEPAPQLDPNISPVELAVWTGVWTTAFWKGIDVLTRGLPVWDALLMTIVGGTLVGAFSMALAATTLPSINKVHTACRLFFFRKRLSRAYRRAVHGTRQDVCDPKGASCIPKDYPEFPPR